MKCLNCNKDYKLIRATSRFCSADCRVTWGRKRVSVTPSELVTLSDADSVTLSNPVGSVSSNSNHAGEVLTKAAYHIEPVDVVHIEGLKMDATAPPYANTEPL